MNFRKIPYEAFGIYPIVRIRDIDAVVSNYLLFKERAERTGSICGAVLKANVHGLQIADVAPALYEADARYFFVAELIEAIELRNILPQPEVHIYTLGGILIKEEPYFKQYRITPCINSLEQLERWNKYCKQHGNDSVIIHLDTHMNRLGLLDEDVEFLSRNIASAISNVKIEFYMSHFYDIKGNDFTNCYRQEDILKSYLKILPEAPVTFACTDSVILLDNKRFNYDMIRPGIGLVGGAPNSRSTVSPDARHTLEMYAKISQIKRIPKGQTVGYGGAYTCKRDTIMALAHIGYKDGYLRSLSETDIQPKGAYMYIDGYRTPIIGKISLDASTIDVTDVPDSVLQNTGYAEIAGPNADIKELADISGCYELMVSLGRENYKIKDYTLKEYNALFAK